MTVLQTVAHLQEAVKAFAAGELKEREFIAVQLAVNRALSEDLGPVYSEMAKNAETALLSRIDELDRGEL